MDVGIGTRARGPQATIALQVAHVANPREEPASGAVTSAPQLLQVRIIELAG
jgi:hypothetical protein